MHITIYENKFLFNGYTNQKRYNCKTHEYNLLTSNVNIAFKDEEIKRNKLLFGTLEKLRSNVIKDKLNFILIFSVDFYFFCRRNFLYFFQIVWGQERIYTYSIYGLMLRGKG
jgi:hypothetical protein